MSVAVGVGVGVAVVSPALRAEAVTENVADALLLIPITLPRIR
jgi:hypothetical protein